MPEDSDTLLIEDWSKFVVGSSSKAILYRDFQTLKRQSRKIEFKERYARWEDSILKDLPKLSKSKWLSSKTNRNLLKEIFKCWFTYSKLGYIQSMLFYLVPLTYVFQKTPYLAFWGFVKIFNNISIFIRETLDPDYSVYALNKDSSEVLYKFSVCYYDKYNHIFSEMQRQVFYLVINYHVHAKCAIGHLANCLRQATIVLDYLMPNVDDKDKFLESLKSISFSLMLCLVLGKTPNELSDKFLMDLNTKMFFTDDALFAILDSAKSSKEIFKNLKIK